MGQTIVVVEKPSKTNRGVVRFETNRMLTGTGHERYVADEEIFGHRPPDEIARRLFTQESVAGVQVHGNMVTVDLRRGYDSTGLAEIIENLYIFYPPVEEAVDALTESVVADVLAPGALDDEPESAEEPAAEGEGSGEGPVEVPEAAADASVEEPAAEGEESGEESGEASEEPAVEPAAEA